MFNLSVIVEKKKIRMLVDRELEPGAVAWIKEPLIDYWAMMCLGPIDTRKRPPPVFSSQGPDTKKFKSGRNWPNDKTPYENAKNSSDPKNSQFLANPNLFTPPPNLQDSLNKSGSTLSKNNPHRSEDDTVSSAKFGSDKGTILNILEDPFGGRNPYSKHERPVSKAHIPEQNLKVDLSLPPPIALPKKPDPVPLSSVLIPPNLPFVKNKQQPKSWSAPNPAKFKNSRIQLWQ